MKRNRVRKETDSMGEVFVPEKAMYGASTQRAVENFPISGLRMPQDFVEALALVKMFAAKANYKHGRLSKRKADAIVRACREVIDGKWNDQFVVDVFQTGSGTSTNTNMNEVLARRARLILRKDPNDKGYIHPNDDVNLSQSSNDVIPTALHLSALLAVKESLLPALASLQNSFSRKAKALEKVVKSGRTHHQDATPITLGQEFSGYAAQLEAAHREIKVASDKLHYLAIGGTAVGTGINSPKGFGKTVCSMMSEHLDVQLKESSNHFRAQASIDDVVAVSSSLKLLAVALIKIVNDLRWMSSGPTAGLAEVTLPAVQPGSSIMPGKVNPVILESAHMVAIQVLGIDSAITFAGQSGNFELNTTLPVVAYNLLQSIELLTNTADNLRIKCIDGIEPNQAGLSGVESNNALATALAPVIGYDAAAKIAKIVLETGETVLEVAFRETDLGRAELEELLEPLKLTEPGNAIKGKKKSTKAKKKRKFGFKVGDKVELLGYKKLAWHDRKAQRYGYVVNVDGSYISVRPRWWPEDEFFELYPNEIKLVKQVG